MRPTTSSTTSSVRSARLEASAVEKYNHKLRMQAARGGPPTGGGGDKVGGGGKPRPLARPLTSSRPESLVLPSPSGDSPRFMAVHGEDSPSCDVTGMRPLGKKCICEICTCGYVVRFAFLPALPPLPHACAVYWASF